MSQLPILSVSQSLLHRLPDSAFWFEPPQMVLWDEQKRCWSNEYFQDVKYNEDQCVMQVSQ